MDEQTPTTEQEVGIVTHYWGHLGVAGVHLTAPLDVGDRIHILGSTSDFEQDVDSIEIDHEKVLRADAGADAGIRVAEHAREHDKIYKLIPAADVGVGEDAL
ncbi:MAG: hypothetical protein OEV43_05725 [Coriobacteriia bacterium]|nr:hypothetical protein [Coriobacteriia bacterium]